MYLRVIARPFRLKCESSIHIDLPSSQTFRLARSTQILRQYRSKVKDAEIVEENEDPESTENREIPSQPNPKSKSTEKPWEAPVQ